MSATANSRDSHFGVMGAVEKPGVYADDSPTPLLVDIVGRAGGLTDRATGNVRIVRGERAGQQTFYTPSLDFRLQRGDLVVVDSRPAARSRHRFDVAGAEPQAAEEAVQLAFLHVLERPIVLKMRATDASIARILQLLRQPADIASTVRVVETGPAYTRGHRDETTRLADGSVLVFDAERIDRGHLPSFPPVIDKSTTSVPPTKAGATEAPANIVPEVARSTPTPEPQPLDDEPVDAVTISRPTRMGVPSAMASMTRRSSPLPLTGDPLLPPMPRAIDENPDVDERPILAGPTSADTIDRGSIRIPTRVAEALDATKPDPVAETSDVPDPSFLESGPATMAEVELNSDPSKTAESSTSGVTTSENREGENAINDSADTGSLIIVLSVLVVAAGLIWFLGRRTENVGSIALHTTEAKTSEPSDATSPRTSAHLRIDGGHEGHRVPSAHVPLSRPSDLDDLIEGRVTFQEEPLSLPNSLELFGKSTTEVWHRIDAGPSANDDSADDTSDSRRGMHRRPRRPHMAARLAESVAASKSETGESSSASTARDESHGRLLDRVLTAVHGARH